MDLVIQEMTMKDYAEVLALWQGAEGIGLSGADSEEGIRSYLARNPGMSLVARHEGRLAGAILAGHDGRRGFLHHLAVAPDFRGLGLGRALVEQCLQRLAAAGIRKCHLHVYAANEDALAFWRAVGWTDRSDLRTLSRDTHGS